MAYTALVAVFLLLAVTGRDIQFNSLPIQLYFQLVSIPKIQQMEIECSVGLIHLVPVEEWRVHLRHAVLTS